MLERIQTISRQDEARLPKFSSHTLAREHFIQTYGDHFVAADSFLIGDERICHEYHLVLNPEAYAAGMSKLRTGQGFSDDGAFLHSYQKIEIMDDGSVHVLH